MHTFCKKCILPMYILILDLLISEVCFLPGVSTSTWTCSPRSRSRTASRWSRRRSGGGSVARTRPGSASPSTSPSLSSSSPTGQTSPSPGSPASMSSSLTVCRHCRLRLIRLHPVQLSKHISLSVFRKIQKYRGGGWPVLWSRQPVHLHYLWKQIQGAK